MQFEAKEPVDRILAPLSHAAKGLVLGDTSVVADPQRSGVNQANPSTRTATGIQVSTQQDQHTRYQGDKTGIANQVREFSLQLDVNVLQVVGFEVTVTRLMKMDENSHDFTVAQFATALALTATAGQLIVLPVGCKKLAEIIDMTE
jgi:hypothetical protein